MAANRTLFLDRDGVINRRIVNGYVANIEQFEFKDDFLEMMVHIAPHFKKIFIVSNQQGVGKGIMTMQQVETVNEFMCHELEQRGINIDKVYICPHLAADNCNCRKPNPGLALQAKNDFPDIDFANSVMIGDSPSDLLFGRKCGMKTVFVNDSNTTITPEIEKLADVIVNNMLQLPDTILDFI